MYIYDKQRYTMHRNHPKHSNLENRCFRYKRPQKSPKEPKKTITQSHLLKKIYRYGIFFMVRGESSCPDGLEYVWERGEGPTL